MNENHKIGLLSISGSDAKKFLQGQLTCNLDEPFSKEGKLGAHCNPQGRVISLFQIFQRDNQFDLHMPASLLPIAVNALKKYAVFFKVSLDTRNFILTTGLSLQEKIAQGIPSIYPETSEKFLPHELNLHHLNAISFNKGCYTGQEIIARMQYRGKLKNHMYRAKTISASLPLRGGEIVNASSPCGSIVDWVEIGYNEYELLVIAPETEVNSTSLFLNLDKKSILEFLTYNRSQGFV